MERIANIAREDASSGDRGEPEPRECLARAQAGDAAAFGEIVRLYEADVMRLCRRLLGSREEAEDATQESFERAHGALSSYDPTRPFRRWLLGIAAHHAIDALRRRRRESRVFESADLDAESLPDPHPSPLQHGLSAELRSQLLATIESQPDHYRAPLVLRYYADLEYGDIAEILSVSRNQVATLLFRGRQRLREALQQGREAAAQRGEAERSVGPREGRDQ